MIFFFSFDRILIFYYIVIPKIELHFFTIYFNLKTSVKSVHYRNPERNSTSYKLYKHCLYKVFKGGGTDKNLLTKLKLYVENLWLPGYTGERDTLGHWHWHIHTTTHERVGNGNPLQYSCPEKPMDREAWRATVHVVSKSQTWLKWQISELICPCGLKESDMNWSDSFAYT